MSMKKEDQLKLDSIKRFPFTILHLVDDFIPITVVAPMERVKLLLQCQNEMLKQGTIIRPYNGVIDCIMQTFRNQGTLSF
ncbi:unnamed protein product [Adineta steineri]|uniref:Uncharacterized protein n=1 Tax=Adineta steineri TaxID=433720 RepID=A0A816CQC1_9BILA|nr:unnamed protein product [Adineta steineri]CAF1624798.1 unnamed protein product [Adineta steineri]